MTTKRDGGLYSEGHLWALGSVKSLGGQMQRHFNALYIKNWQGFSLIAVLNLNNIYIGYIRYVGYDEY